jgi:hypothetical protein
MYAGAKDEALTSGSTRRRIALGFLFLAVAGFVCLAYMPLRIHRTADEDDRLVAELIAPRSGDQLLASIAELNSQTQVSHAGGRVPDQWKMLKLSGALYRVLLAHPELPEAWRAAGSRIAIRAVPNIPAPSEVCGRQHNLGNNISDLPSIDHKVLPKYSNCTIVLDDAPQIVNSNPIFFKRRSAQQANESRRPLLRLQNAHVIYRGGQILPIDALACIDCTFEFDILSAPPKRGRSLMRALLIAPDITNVGIEISEDEPTLRTPRRKTYK